ncbi:hypothetical protein M080_2957 [Bacteroides fragilis str. 3397 T10]|nr:hypothetical protein M080_2957 [Bacteroides fragilis str. 3397 T10]EXZ52868.1 hypothetical protein M108_3251 [Bacteroides fragilis str. 3397 T14]
MFIVDKEVSIPAFARKDHPWDGDANPELNHLKNSILEV